MQTGLASAPDKDGRRETAIGIADEISKRLLAKPKQHEGGAGEADAA